MRPRAKRREIGGYGVSVGVLVREACGLVVHACGVPEDDSRPAIVQIGEDRQLIDNSSVQRCVSLSSLISFLSLSFKTGVKRPALSWGVGAM